MNRIVSEIARIGGITLRKRSFVREPDFEANHRRRMLAQWRAARALHSEGFTRVCGRLKRYTREQYFEFKSALDDATGEREAHAFLKEHLDYIPCSRRSCYWVRSEPALGGEFRPDFMTCHMDSSGMSWTLVELEGPYDQVFTSKGRPAARLREAFEQVDDWRQWLQHQDGFAANSAIYRGLAGLPHNTSNVDGLVIIGRSSQRSEGDDFRIRQQIERRRDTDLHSYDWLLREMKFHVVDGEQDGYRSADAARCPDCRVVDKQAASPEPYLPGFDEFVSA
jgi:hypothetical protein